MYRHCWLLLPVAILSFDDIGVIYGVITISGAAYWLRAPVVIVTTASYSVIVCVITRHTPRMFNIRC